MHQYILTRITTSQGQDLTVRWIQQTAASRRALSACER